MTACREPAFIPLGGQDKLVTNHATFAVALPFSRQKTARFPLGNRAVFMATTYNA
ncbi:hypothetical protein HMPREF9080_00504 [Cardiobacterium valvarum F0432]|uniref:Uncharacterized protein n=1 Tax=Cardiobacterium valvarum F0432 TaxID=797473 RepID=G9ZCM7_9GAMM|nr:hypothetical protein HMPREF9080_00504 [Cardiobacterium valvarum F0432]